MVLVEPVMVNILMTGVKRIVYEGHSNTFLSGDANVVM